MLPEPSSIIAGYGFRKLADALLSVLFNKKLSDKLLEAVKNWLNDLPEEYSSVKPNALLPDINSKLLVPDSPYLNELKACIKINQTPEPDLLFNVLLEHWEAKRSILGVIAHPIFLCSPEEIKPYLEKLAISLYLVCELHDPFWKAAIHRQNRHGLFQIPGGETTAKPSATQSSHNYELKDEIDFSVSGILVEPETVEPEYLEAVRDDGLEHAESSTTSSITLAETRASVVEDIGLLEELREHISGEVGRRLEQIRTDWHNGQKDKTLVDIQALKSNVAIWSHAPDIDKAKVLRFEASIQLHLNSDAEQAKQLADEAHALAPDADQGIIRALIVSYEGDNESALQLLTGRNDIDSLNLKAAILMQMGRFDEVLELTDIEDIDNDE